MAVLFAAATAVPAWSRLSQGGGSGREQLAPAIIFFALLCWINCVGIEKWEGGVFHATTRWAGLHLRLIVTMTALFALAAAVLAPSRGLAAVYLAAPAIALAAVTAAWLAALVGICGVLRQSPTDWAAWMRPPQPDTRRP